jgi:hypothetical protein
VLEWLAEREFASTKRYAQPAPGGRPRRVAEVPPASASAPKRERIILRRPV